MRFAINSIGLAAVTLMLCGGAAHAGGDREQARAARAFLRCALTPPLHVDGTIADAVVASEDLETLELAVGAAGLVDVLSGPGPFTVYAPVDAAFAELPPALVGFLLDPANQQDLVSVLTLHVTPGAGERNDPRWTLTPREVATAQPDGQTVFFNRGRSGPQVNQSNVACQPVQTDNGTVFLIDSVLSPQYTADPR